MGAPALCPCAVTWPVARTAIAPATRRLTIENVHFLERSLMSLMIRSRDCTCCSSPAPSVYFGELKISTPTLVPAQNRVNVWAQPFREPYLLLGSVTGELRWLHSPTRKPRVSCCARHCGTAARRKSQRTHYLE